ncbi:hypothetical protein Aoki45_16940 [Algoriphagus sp. oki45]|nr:hypothetical protein Aoki45_16940 [Algoriphagus sp. oki45]
MTIDVTARSKNNPSIIFKFCCDEAVFMWTFLQRLLRGLPLCFDIQSLLKAPRNDDRRHCEEQIQILNYFRCLLRRSSLYVELYFKRLLRGFTVFY